MFNKGSIKISKKTVELINQLFWQKNMSLLTMPFIECLKEIFPILMSMSVALMVKLLSVNIMDGILKFFYIK